MHTIKGYKDEWRIQEYLLITFFISWLSWGILILLTALKFISFQSVLGIILFMIGGFGPTIAAIMCLEGKISFKKIWQFITEHKKKTIGYLLLFAGLMIAIVIFYDIFRGTTWVEPVTQTPFSASETTLCILALIGTFFFTTLLGGGNEELGWRGTLQPLMGKVISKKVKNRFLSYVLTVLAIGLIWAVWHLPLWFVSGGMQQSMNYGLFVLECIAMSAILGCIYEKTHSVLYCMILHGLANTLLGCLVPGSNWILVVGFIVMAILAIILGPRTSSPSLKVTTKTKS